MADSSPCLFCFQTVTSVYAENSFILECYPFNLFDKRWALMRKYALNALKYAFGDEGIDGYQGWCRWGSGLRRGRAGAPAYLPPRFRAHRHHIQRRRWTVACKRVSRVCRRVRPCLYHARRSGPQDMRCRVPGRSAHGCTRCRTWPSCCGRLGIRPFGRLPSLRPRCL